jgi:hypothetical protein
MHNQEVRADRTTAIVGALAINAVLLLALATLSGPRPAARPRLVELTLEPGTYSNVTTRRLEPVGSTGGAGGTYSTSTTSESRTRAPEHRTSQARRTAARPTPEPGVLSGIDAPDGNQDGRCGAALGSCIGIGHGNGIGIGIGNGIGFGEGGRVHPIADLPAPPPPPVSKARPAKLLHPTRQTEVDEAELFAAIVTVDTEGDVVGARMTQSHPGTRGDTASSMIWQFRYAPALDFDGAPIKSTFVQAFAVR